MRGDPKGLWPRSKLAEITTALLGLAGVGTKGQEILWVTVQDVKMGDTWVPNISNNLQRFCGRSGKGSYDGSLQASGGTSRSFLGIR